MSGIRRSRRRSASEIATSGLVVDVARRSGLLNHQPGTYVLVPVVGARDRQHWAVSPTDVLVALCRYRDVETGLCCPSIVRLAADLGVHRRTIERSLRALESAGYVVVQRRTGGRRGGYTSSQYHIVFRDAGRAEAASAETQAVEAAPETTEDEKAPSDRLMANEFDATPSVASKDGNVVELPTQSWDELVDKSLSMRQMVSHPDATDGVATVTDSLDQNHEAVSRGTVPQSTCDHEARQEVRRRDRHCASDPQPVSSDPTAALVRWISGRTGQHQGAVTCQVLEWISHLERGGFSAAEAPRVVAGVGGRVRFGGMQGDVIAEVEARVHQCVADRRWRAA